MKKTVLGALILGMFIALSISVSAETMCIMPEDFSDSLGTFSVTTEGETVAPFRGISLRGKTDSQVANTIPAQVVVGVSEDATYTLYARTRDFDTNPGKRVFRLNIDKIALTETPKLGAHNFNGWKWEKAGSAELKKGTHNIKVYDISAFYARFDMLILTNEEIKLPETTEEMQKMLDNYHMKDTGEKPEKYFAPNKVYRTGYFYTSCHVNSLKDLGSWSRHQNVYVRNSETPSRDSYLLGGKGENAKITFAVPKDGKYYIWVRSRDTFDNQGTRTFKSLIDGVLLDGVFGNHGIEGWTWERKEATLNKGYHVLEFEAESEYAHFDMFMITDDEEFAPSFSKSGDQKMLFEAPFNPIPVAEGAKCPINPEVIKGNITKYPQRPSTEYAVSLNKIYFECQSIFDFKEPYIEAKKALVALGYVEAESDLNHFVGMKDGKTLKIFANDIFAQLDKKKIEMRSIPQTIDGCLMIPVSFLNKSDSVSAKINGKDIEITHLVWK